MFQTLPKAERMNFMALEDINNICRGLNIANPLWQGFIQDPSSISRHLAYSQLIHNASSEEREYYLSCARAFTALKGSTDEAIHAYYLYQKRRAQAASAASKTHTSLMQLMEGCTRVVKYSNYANCVLVWNLKICIRKGYFDLRDGEEIFLQGFLDEGPRADCFALEATSGDAARRFRLQVKQVVNGNGQVKVRFIRGGGRSMVKMINDLVERIESQLESPEDVSGARS
ncbi:hypothetical protein BKA56DRAFT_367765 [Ilyonectria sp. MPI-CAGE-AT-0026]|nr:hypothetical protein BKA56DRAFT_367765 [Ilyonectria sp. MPI-CAGE-AT-0026]